MGRGRRTSGRMVRIAAGAACVAIGVAVAAGSARADEMDDMRAMLEAQQRRLDQLERDARSQRDLQNQLEETAARLAERADSGKLPDWVQRTKFKGDFRFRHEIIDDDRAGRNTDRNRQRIRARAGFTHEVNEDVDVTFRLATGNESTTTVVTAVGPPATTANVGNGTSSPTSTNQTLGDAFTSKPVWMDLAYFNYHPHQVKGFSILGGKMPNVFNKPVGNSDLIWDGDVTPEGLAAAYKQKLGDNFEVFVQGGGFWVSENRRPADQSLWAVQGGGVLALGENGNFKVKGGAGYYDYGNVDGKATALGTAGGNKTAGGVYLDDYNLVNVFGEVGGKVGGVGLAAFGDFVRNQGASDNQTGWLVGGSAAYKKFKVTYNYRKVDQNAVLGALADGDWLQGGVNGHGHKVSLGYKLGKNWEANATYFNSERGRANAGGADVKLCQFDLVFKIQ